MHTGRPPTSHPASMFGYNVPDHEDVATPVGLPGGVSSRIQLFGGLYQVQEGGEKVLSPNKLDWYICSLRQGGLSK